MEMIFLGLNLLMVFIVTLSLEDSPDEEMEFKIAILEVAKSLFVFNLFIVGMYLLIKGVLFC